MKKTKGTDDLTKTMVKQHGVEKTYWIAKEKSRTASDSQQRLIWNRVALNIENLR